MTKHFIVFFATCLFCNSIVQSQQLNTDRPDQSDGASVIDKGNIQLETSVYLTTFNDGQHSIISSCLVRFGISKNIEFRLLAEQGKGRDLFMEETAQSQYPSAISMKWSLVKDRSNFPDLSLVGYLQVPVTNGKQPAIWSPAVLIVVEKEIRPFTVTINAGPRQEAFSHEWDLQTTADLKLDLSRHWQLFGEYFAQFGKALPFNNVDGGVLYYPNNKWMVHASAGTSLDHHPSNYFFSTGVAIQLN